LEILKYIFYTFAKFYFFILNSLQLYSISLTGVKEGVHHYKFDLNDKFFHEFYNEEDQPSANIVAEVEMIKHSLVITLNIKIQGNIRVCCDRCLEDFDLEISGQSRLYVKNGEEDGELSEDVIVVSESTTEIPLAQHFYELYNLSLPLRYIHPEDEDGQSLCNQEMINKLNEHILKPEENTDPRWDSLKKLIDK
jgi:uncharacterized metal-binding protein YceD (DUF177 family)